jgi:hypothetical protein
VDLRWKWKAEESFYVQTTTTVKQTMVIEDQRAAPSQVLAARGVDRLPLAVSPGGSGPLNAASALLYPLRWPREREIGQEFEHVCVLHYRVESVDPKDGSAVLTQRVVWQTVKGGEVEKFDTTLDNARLTLHVDARGQVTKVEGAKALLEKLTPEQQEAVGEALSEENLRTSTSQALGLLPGEADKVSKVGQTWSRTVPLKLGGLGQLELARDFVLESMADGGGKAKIDFTTRVVRYRPAKGEGRGYRLSEGLLTTVQGKGAVELDLSAGRPVRSSANLTLAGFFTFHPEPRTTYRMRLTQWQTVKTTVSDKEPPRPDIGQ